MGQISRVIFFLVALMLSTPGRAFIGENLGVLNPTTHRSASGQYSLFVDPSDRNGFGPANYVFAKDGVAVWTNVFRFALRETAITATGHVIGYAYSADRKANGLDEKIVVASFDPDGNQLLVEHHHREMSRYLHGRPTPFTWGRIHLLSGNRAFFQAADWGTTNLVSDFWSYDLNHGDRIDLKLPKPPVANPHQLSFVGAMPVAGTPLSIIHWAQIEGRKVHALFTVVGESLELVWTRTVENDYTDTEDTSWVDSTLSKVRKRNLLRGGKRSGEFDLWLVKQEVLARHRVERDVDGSWTVSRIDDSPLVWNTAESQPERPGSHLALEKILEIPLRADDAQPKSPLTELTDFAFDPSGNICALREARGAGPTLMYISSKNVLLDTLSLPDTDPTMNSDQLNLSSVGQGRFIISVNRNKTASWFLADFKQGQVSALTNAQCPTVTAVAGISDGRFLALTSEGHGDGVFLFGSTGSLLWSIRQDGYRDLPHEWISPTSITWLKEDRIGLLDGSLQALLLYNTNGSFLRRIELEKKWNRKHLGLETITSDGRGNAFIHDQYASRRLIRIDSEGTIQDSLVPKRSNGRRMELDGPLRMSPAGRLWYSDGMVLRGLSCLGRAQRTIGQPQSKKQLWYPGWVHMDGDDRVNVMDKKTKQVFTFDHTGRHVPRVRRRSSNERSGVDRISESMRQEMYGPLRHKRWATGHDVIFFNDDSSRTTRTIRKLPNGHWINGIGCVSVSPAEDLAIISHGSICIYSHAGDPVKMFSLPASDHILSLSFTRDYLFAAGRNAGYFFTPNGRLIGSARIPERELFDGIAGPFAAMDGTELWAVSSAPLKLDRYRVPQAILEAASKPR